MRKCNNCGTIVKDNLSFCQQCGTVMPSRHISTTSINNSNQGTKKNLGCLKIFLWLFFLPIMIIITIVKSKRLSKKGKTIILTVISIFYIIIALTGNTEKSDSSLENTNSEIISSELDSTEQEKDYDKDTSSDVITPTTEIPEPVTEPTIESIILTDENKRSLDLTIGDTIDIGFQITPRNISQENFELTVSDDSIIIANFVSYNDGKFVYTIQSLNEGTTTLNLHSIDNSITSGDVSITVNPIVQVVEKPVQETDTSRTVYVTPSGEKYHYDPNCGGKNSSPTTLNKAKITRDPCKKCVY